MVHIIMGLLTLLLLLFHFLRNWEEYKDRFGDTGVKVLATFGMIAGPLVYPITLIALALLLLLKIKSAGDAQSS